MAAPADASLTNLEGRWSMNPSLSGPYDSVLKAQNINWLTRKVLTMSSVVISVHQCVDENNLMSLTIHSKPQSGLPGTTEERTLDGEPSEITHVLFGKIRGRTTWVSRSELPSAWLGEGLEEDKIMLFTTDHLDINAITYQANGFEEIKGTRRYVRHVEVKKGEECLRVKLVYDYLGPLAAEK